MAKGEGRGWRKYLPTPVTIVKVFVALVVIKLISVYTVASLPQQVRTYWPNIV
jgi:hypothetical protein